MYTRPIEPTLDWIDEPFAKQRRWCATPTSPRSRPATTSARPPSCSTTRYEVEPADAARRAPTRNITGNTALAWGLVAAGQLAKLPIFLGATRSRRRPTSSTSCRSTRTSACARCRPRTRSPAVGAALGAAFAGHLGVTTTSGPGVALKAETIGLAVSLELPLLIIDIQRGGPSTGLPTKTEQADLLLAMYGRHGEAPLPIVAAYSPSHCFDAAIEAARIALKYRTPVILLSDGYLANGAEPWLLPDVDDAARHLGAVRHRARTTSDDDGDARVLALPPRPRDAGPAVGDPRHARAHAPHRRHREGGRLRQHLLRRPRTTSAWSHLRAAKVAGIANDIPPARGRRRRRRRRAARARLGLDVGRHRRRGRAAGPARARRWPGSTSSTSTRSRPTSARSLRRYRQGARARDEPRPAVRARPGRVPRRRQVGHQGPGRRRSPPPSSRGLRRGPGRTNGSSHERHRSSPLTTSKDWTSDQEVRWCPGCGDYSHPHRGPAADARARRDAREHGVRLRHRLLEPLPVLHEHLRHALHPRPGAGDRHRARDGPARPRRVGRSPATATCCRSAATT